MHTQKTISLLTRKRDTFKQEVQEKALQIEERKRRFEAISQQVLQYHTEKLQALQLELQRLSPKYDRASKWLIIILGASIGPQIANTILSRTRRMDDIGQKILQEEHFIKCPRYSDEQRSIINANRNDEQDIARLEAKIRDIDAEIEALKDASLKQDLVARLEAKIRKKDAEIEALKASLQAKERAAQEKRWRKKVRRCNREKNLVQATTWLLARLQKCTPTQAPQTNDFIEGDFIVLDDE